MDIDVNKYSPSRIIKAISPRVKLGRADLHIHSNYSDGKPSIEEILDYVQYKTDLNVIAITDHDTIEGAIFARSMARSKGYRFEVIVGEEISCLEGHLLALYIKEAIQPNQKVSEAIKQVRVQGGISVAAHPFYHTRLKNDHMVVMNGIGAKELIANHHGLDAIEIVNSTPTLADENLAASFINRTLLFRSETGSSDAHILDAIGRGYTVFEGKTSDDLRHAIKHQQTQAMYRGWTVLAAMKYLWFFIPKGFRLLWSNIVRIHEA